MFTENFKFTSLFLRVMKKFKNMKVHVPYGCAYQILQNLVDLEVLVDMKKKSDGPATKQLLEITVFMAFKDH